MNAYIFGNTDCQCARVKAQERIYSLNRGVESLSKEEHGLFFDAMQRLGLPNEVKQAAVALYLDFKSRPIGEYNAEHKHLAHLPNCVSITRSDSLGRAKD